jgi:phage replication O-like protein O
MANPQIKNGYTRIANELLEALCRINLSAYENRVIRTIERKTFGFGKKEDRISIRQLANITDLDFRHAHRALTSLVRRNIVKMLSEPGKTSIIGIQKNYELWDKPTIAYSGDTLIGDTSTDVPTVTYSGIGTVTSTDDNKRKKKPLKKNPEKISAEISSLLQRYSNQDLIIKAFDAIARTRKTNRVAPSVLLNQLQNWAIYPVESVESSIQAYLAKDYAGQGKKENYLLGIIRNSQDLNNSTKTLNENWLAGAI